jgi:hypothetical protein
MTVRDLQAKFKDDEVSLEAITSCAI